MKFDNGLDPSDWDAFSGYVSDFVKNEYQELATSLESAVWKPLSDQSRDFLQHDALPVEGEELDQVVEKFRQHIRPYRAGNTHSRFFGWVQGSGTLPALMADFAAGAMNSNCGGREHSAIYVERLVMQWCKQIFSFPEDSAGVLTSGTSASTHLAMQLAMYKKMGLEYKKKGLFGQQKPLRCYTSIEGHSSIIKAIHACGIGTDNLIVIPADEQHKITLEHLENKLKQDLQDGFEPFMVIANAGTVNTGAFDDFAAVKELCDKYNCWMHVDGAFGAWIKLTNEPYQQLTKNIEMADSIAFDFHKLIYVQYDCGALLVKDGDFQQKVFTVRPNYIAKKGRALAGGDPWFCDFGLELSRSFRALKVWFTLKTYGLKKLGESIQLSCDLAALLAGRIDQSKHFEMLDRPISNILTFKLRVVDDVEQHNELCEEIVARLQISGEAVFSLTRNKDLRVIRASITNHRTRKEDIEAVVEILENHAAHVLQQAVAIPAQ